VVCLAQYGGVTNKTLEGSSYGGCTGCNCTMCTAYPSCCEGYSATQHNCVYDSCNFPAGCPSGYTHCHAETVCTRD